MFPRKFVSRKVFEQKLDEVERTLTEKGLLSLDGTGPPEIEWLLSYVRFLAGWEIVVYEEEDTDIESEDMIKRNLGTGSPLSTEQDS